MGDRERMSSSKKLSCFFCAHHAVSPLKQLISKRKKEKLPRQRNSFLPFLSSFRGPGRQKWTTAEVIIFGGRDREVGTRRKEISMSAINFLFLSSAGSEMMMTCRRLSLSAFLFGRGRLFPVRSQVGAHYDVSIVGSHLKAIDEIERLK